VYALHLYAVFCKILINLVNKHIFEENNNGKDKNFDQIGAICMSYCSEYFHKNGLPELIKRLFGIIKDELQGYPIDKKCSIEEIEHLFKKIENKFERVYLTGYLVPNVDNLPKEVNPLVINLLEVTKYTLRDSRLKFEETIIMTFSCFYKTLETTFKKSLS